MTRSVFIYGGVLIASLAFAWVRFTAEPTPDITDKVVLLQGDAEDIEKITWSTDADSATIEQKEDGHGRFLWVDYTKKVAPPPAPSAEGEAPPPPPPPAEEASHEAFKAGTVGDELLTALSPMLAIRRLDGVDEAKLETIGLATPSGELQVTRKGRTATFQIGGEAFGTRDVYMRDTSDGAIYLVDDQTIRPLKYARTRLPDRTLFSVARADVETATLTAADGASLAILQQNAADEANARWVRTSAPDVEDRQLDTWMEKALELKGSAYADPDEPLPTLEPRFTLVLVKARGEKETLEVLQDPASGDWWGRSEHTRGLMKLLKGPSAALSEDISDVINNTAPPPEEDAGSGGTPPLAPLPSSVPAAPGAGSLDPASPAPTLPPSGP